jgi:all-trans-retinol 13,14-reductase
MMTRGNVVIIGSGLGGLACGAILAKEGYRVTVLEKNKQIGGMLQIFVRDKVIFDTGIHYVGGLDKGQNLYQLFNYLGIMDKLDIRKMDPGFFDGIMLGDDPVVYKYAQGYDAFVRQMVEYFPEEKNAIQTYCDKIRRICSQFPLYNLRSGTYSDEEQAFTTDTKAYLESITSNRTLVNVLAGTNLLYAGEPDKTPLFVHALIINHYIESAWKFVDGGSQIARLLSREITSRGGRVVKHVHVVTLREEAGRIQYAEATNGDRYEADLYISNVHPLKTIEMTDSTLIKNAYRTRLKSLSNTTSVFYANVVLKKDALRTMNSNLYVLEKNDAWCSLDYTEESWPQGFALFFVTSSADSEFAEGLTIMSYMRIEEVEKWTETFNTVDDEHSRGDDYEKFKEHKAQKLFDAVERRLPGFRDAIQSFTTATPLTARDYIGTDDGALYGFAKDYRDPMKTTISPRTKIPNLLLTGQNINMHGVLGVTLSAVVTCSQVLGMEYLVDKIKNA